MLQKTMKSFFGINSFDTGFYLGNEIKELISEENVRNKFELNLRKSGIQIDEDSPYVLGFTINGVWDAHKVTFTIQYKLSLFESVVLNREGDMRTAWVESWTTGNYGYASRIASRDAIVRAVETASETLANSYLKAIEKEKRKKGAEEVSR